MKRKSDLRSYTNSLRERTMGIFIDKPIEQTMEQETQQTEFQETHQPKQKNTDQHSTPHKSQQSDQHSTPHKSQQSDQHSTPHKSQQSDQHSTPHKSQQSILPFEGLTEKQQRVAHYLQKCNGVTSLKEIVEHTGIPYGTVRDNINRLIKEGFISPIKRYARGKIRGFSYIILRKF